MVSEAGHSLVDVHNIAIESEETLASDHHIRPFLIGSRTIQESLDLWSH